jgi:hypothetical protein
MPHWSNQPARLPAKRRSESEHLLNARTAPWDWTHSMEVIALLWR